MAQDAKATKPTDKGKGKATESTQKASADGKSEKGKDGKTEKGKDGKPGEEATDELNEEDQQLKDELDMIVERLTETNKELHKPAIEAMKTSIKTSTSSMTAVPKPLKFLRPHYHTLTKLYDEWPESDDRTSLADVLSVIGMTFSDEECQDTLKYRLLAPTSDIGSWGHEYIRHLALEIGEVHAKRVVADEVDHDLVQLALDLVPIFLKSNAEADAVDLMSELEIIDRLTEFVDEMTYPRVCLYLTSMVNLLTYPDNETFLKVAHDIYVRFEKWPQALILAMNMDKLELVNDIMERVKDPLMRRQLSLLIARQGYRYQASDDDEELQEPLSNVRMPEYFKALGKQLNVLEPKTAEDIYKSHLESSRVAGLTNLDSASHNLATSFVNGFVNAGFMDDKLMLTEDEHATWVWKTRGTGMTSTIASLGLLMLWNTELALDRLDRYTYLTEPPVLAGSYLAMGVASVGVRVEGDPIIALLADLDRIRHSESLVRIACCMGIGLAYAGSHSSDALDALMPVVTNRDEDIQVSCIAALGAGLIAIGSKNHELVTAMIEMLIDNSTSEERPDFLADKWTRFIALGIGLFYWGKQEEADVIIEAIKAIPHPSAPSIVSMVEICAWAGTGAVLKIQELLRCCSVNVSDQVEKEFPMPEQKGTKEYEAAEAARDEKKQFAELQQQVAVLGIAVIAMGEDIGQEMVLRQFGHLMHYGDTNIRRVVPLAMGLVSASNPQMKVYDTLSRYSHDTDIEVAISAIFAMGLVGAGTNNARLAQLLRQLASYYHRDSEVLLMVRIAQGLLHLGKGTMTLSPFHTDRQLMSPVAAGGLMAVLVAMMDAREVVDNHHYLLYFLTPAIQPRMLVTLDEDMQPLTVSVRVGQAVDVVGQAGRPKTITGWQTQSTPVLLGYGERAELEDEEYISLSSSLEGLVILRKNPDWVKTE